ncbi:MAG: hypothetical protein ACAI43_21640 [Phycisphaerae bacterium]
MLALPPDASHFTAGAIAGHLLAQVHGRRRRERFGHDMLAAGFDLFVAAFRARTGKRLSVRNVLPGEWRVNDGVFAYSAVVDDDALERWASLYRGRATVVPIVPDESAEVARLALKSRVNPARFGGLFTFSGFVDWRVLWGGLDIGWRKDTALRWMLEAYNRRAAVDSRGDALRVRLTDL